MRKEPALHSFTFAHHPDLMEHADGLFKILYEADGIKELHSSEAYKNFSEELKAWLSNAELSGEPPAQPHSFNVSRMHIANEGGFLRLNVFNNLHGKPRENSELAMKQHAETMKKIRGFLLKKVGKMGFIERKFTDDELDEAAAESDYFKNL